VSCNPYRSVCRSTGYLKKGPSLERSKTGMSRLWLLSIIPVGLSMILAHIPWLAEVRYGSPAWIHGETEVTLPMATGDYVRSTVNLPTDTGDLLDAWLYRPKASWGMSQPWSQSCVIMAHGLVRGVIGCRSSESEVMESFYTGNLSNDGVSRGVRRIWVSTVSRTSLHPKASPSLCLTTGE